MPQVGIRELKNEASEIIRTVREERVEYVVTHRGKPVAVILPVAEDWQEAEAARGCRGPRQCRFPGPAGGAGRRDRRQMAERQDSRGIDRRAEALTDVCGRFCVGRERAPADVRALTPAQALAKWFPP